MHWCSSLDHPQCPQHYTQPMKKKQWQADTRWYLWHSYTLGTIFPHSPTWIVWSCWVGTRVKLFAVTTLHPKETPLCSWKHGWHPKEVYQQDGGWVAEKSVVLLFLRRFKSFKHCQCCICSMSNFRVVSISESDRSPKSNSEIQETCQVFGNPGGKCFLGHKTKQSPGGSTKMDWALIVHLLVDEKRGNL